MNNASPVEALLFAALEKTNEAERAAFLDSACGGDADLRGQVERLLMAHAKAGDFLHKPAVEQLAEAQESSDATQALDPSTDHKGSAVTRTVGEAASDDDNSDLGFLQRSNRPDSLGRLGHYEVLQVLGKGGFGIVFRAFDDILQRVVALKVMTPQLAATSPARKRFIREALSSAKIRHDNVVRVYEIGEQPLPFLAMEFIPGETLQQRLDRVGPLDVPETVRIGRQIAEGLAAAHAMDLIHRDIKPGNVLLEGGQHRVKIADFGLARAADDASISQSGIIAGTPMYMAPEQAEGQTLDQRADLFSLGSVLYHMVAGRPPFRASTTVAVLRRVAYDTPRPIREIIPETPQWLCDIIARLHAKKPEERFQSAREVADLLADCETKLKANQEEGNTVLPTAPGAVQPARRKWVAAAAVLLLPVLALAVTEYAGVTHLFQEKETLVPRKPAGDPKPGVVAKQEPTKTFTNGIGMEFVLVPKGKSWLGGGTGRVGDKEVQITADFYLGKYEVTQEEWEKVMGENPSTFSHTGGGKDVVKDIPYADMKRFPVENMSWDQCQVFVAKLNKLEMETGWVYRLPTEAEWEYACRGGPMSDKADSAFDFYFARPTNSLLPDQANFAHNNGLKRTCKVGSYEPNALGLYDMHGNVWEWCEDVLQAPNEPSERVNRGGSLSNVEFGCKTMFRQQFTPSNRRADRGLRLARVPAGAASPETKPLVVMPFTDADVQRIAALPAAEQVEEVRKELKKRNPYFDGTVGHKIEDGVVKEFSIPTDNDTVSDLSPVRAFPGLQVLECSRVLVDLGPLRGLRLKVLNLNNNTKLTDLRPLVGMPLESLHLWAWGGTDLSPLKGMPLKWLNIGGGGQKLDLTPLAGLPLESLTLNHQQVSDLAPLRNVPLIELSCEGTLVSDLSPLRGKLLQRLYLVDTKVSDLSALRGMPLTVLKIKGTAVTDLSPLKDTPLKKLECDFRPERDAEILRSIKTLEKINGKPVAQFWKKVDPKQGLDPVWLKRVAGLSAAEQVEEVLKELKERNPYFDGTVGHKIEDGVVKEFSILADNVSDISPVRAFPGLQVLGCSGTGALVDLGPLRGLRLKVLDLNNNTKLTDLRPLVGMPLERLHLWAWGGTDLSPLKGMPLKWLNIGGNRQKLDLTPLAGLPLETLLFNYQQVSDLTPLRDMPLIDLSCLNTLVSDLSPLRSKKLQKLNLMDTKVSDLSALRGTSLTVLLIKGTAVTDLSPLKDTPLKELECDFRPERDAEILRSIKTLEKINGKPVAQFWKEVDPK